MVRSTCIANIEYRHVPRKKEKKNNHMEQKSKQVAHVPGLLFALTELNWWFVIGFE